MNSTSSYPNGGTINILSSILVEIYTYWYLISPLVSVLNNIIVILVFSKKDQIFIKTSEFVRIDYLVLAGSDIFIMTSYYFTKWLGMQMEHLHDIILDF